MSKRKRPKPDIRNLDANARDSFVKAEKMPRGQERDEALREADKLRYAPEVHNHLFSYGSSRPSKAAYQKKRPSRGAS